MSLRKTGWNHYTKQGLLSAICENNTNRKTYLSVEYGDELKSLETSFLFLICSFALYILIFAFSSTRYASTLFLCTLVPLYLIFFTKKVRFSLNIPTKFGIM